MDDGDRAERLERERRDISLARIRAKGKKAPALKVDEDNNRICIDCDAIINPQRLAAQPNAKRCVTCQEVHEINRRKYT